MTYIRISKETDVDFVASRLRDADRREVEASTTETPHDALMNGFMLSKPYCYSVINDLDPEDHYPIAMMGIVPFEMGGAVGSVWLLGTDDITDVVPIGFCKSIKRFFKEATRPYSMICNAVDKRNEVHIKWIKWLGFKFLREINRGPNNMPFYEFARLNHV